jgi:putative addiction module killer protein
MYPQGCISAVFRPQQTDRFEKWLIGLRDAKARARILARLESLQLGNLGDSKSPGDRLGELRIHFGPGYRLHYTVRGGVLVILLCGADKSTQKRDMARAMRILKDLPVEKRQCVA